MSVVAARTFSITRYRPTDASAWDAFVRKSKNGTFLFVRDYMDYHSSRFVDCSMIVRAADDIVALFPANSSGPEIHSHQGLTYGGLIVSNDMTTPVMLDLFEALLAQLRQDGFTRLHYKTIPSIYHRLPAEEDRYALFRTGATLSRRDVLSVIPLDRRGPPQERRRRGAAKAERHGIVVAQAEDWSSYWTLLTEHLQARYGVAPVHSLIEIELLRKRFAKEIRMFEARLGTQVLAGVVIFESAMVAHVQYIGSSDLGRKTGALDLIFHHLIENVFADKPYLDFGSSNDQQGRYLNRGLIEQKEGFGARAVVHDFYQLDLTGAAP